MDTHETREHPSQSPHYQGRILFCQILQTHASGSQILTVIIVTQLKHDSGSQTIIVKIDTWLTHDSGSQTLPIIVKIKNILGSQILSLKVNICFRYLTVIVIINRHRKHVW